MNLGRSARAIRSSVIGLAIGVVVGAAAMHAVDAQPQTIKRMPLLRTDLTAVPDKEVYVTLIEAQPGADFPAHIHYGDEFAYVIDGTLEGFIDQTPSTVNAGSTFHAPREKIHGGKIGSAPAKLLAVHVVDKGKPLTEFVKR